MEGPAPNGDKHAISNQNGLWRRVRPVLSADCKIKWWWNDFGEVEIIDVVIDRIG